MNRKIDVFLILILSCFIIVFCILGLYNHPQSDDYSFALTVKQLGFFNAQEYWNTHWSGRFFSNFLASLQPMLVNQWFIYRILPALFNLFLIVSVYRFMKPYIKNENHKISSVFIALSIIIVWLSHNPTLAETLFWYTGFVNYIFPIPFTLYLVFILCKYQSKLTIKQLICSVLSIMILAGSSELFLIFDIFWIFLWLFLKSLQKSFSFSDAILFVEVLLLASFVMISSGNQHRSSIVDTYQNPLGVISYSFFYAIRFIIYVFENGSLFFLTILSFLFLNFSFFRSLKYKYRVWILVYFLMFIWASFAFVVWFTGDKVPARFLSAMFFLSILATPIFVYSLINEKWLLKIQHVVSIKPVKWTVFVLFLIALCLPGRGTIKFNHPMNGNLMASAKILLNGDAENYNVGMLKRRKLLIKSENFNGVVPSVKYPNELCYMDLSADTSNWYNVKVAGFFGVKSIKTDGTCHSSESQKIQY